VFLFERGSEFAPVVDPAGGAEGCDVPAGHETVNGSGRGNQGVAEVSGDAVQAPLLHGEREGAMQSCDAKGFRVGLVGTRQRMLKSQADADVGWVEVDLDVGRFRGGWNDAGGFFARGGAGGEVAEGIFDEAARGVWLDVADDDDGDAFRAVPSIVECGEVFAREGANGFLDTDDGAASLAGVGPEEGKSGFTAAVARGVARGLLAEDHAAFAFDERGVERGLGAVFVEGGQALLERGGGRVGKFEVIDGVVVVCEGGVIGTEADAEALEGVDQRVARMGAGAAENHVLDEMREAALVVAFVQRADGDDEPERDAVAWFGVAPDDVAEAVGQRTLNERGIGGEIGAKLGPRRGAEERRPCAEEKEEENAAEPDHHRGAECVIGRAESEARVARATREWPVISGQWKMAETWSEVAFHRGGRGIGAGGRAEWTRGPALRRERAGSGGGVLDHDGFMDLAER